MGTLADIRDLVREDLRDPDDAIWSDAQLERHVEHAVFDYSMVNPQEKTATIQHDTDARTVDLSTITNRIRIVAVEFPVGEYPPRYVPFSHWGDTLTMDLAAAPSGQADVKIYYHAEHTINGTTTFPALHNNVIATGAAGYACLELTADTANKVNVGGENAWGRYLELAAGRSKSFHQQLRAIAEAYANRIKTSRLYTPVPGGRLSTETTDPGPI
jgi:hypothetical protein